MTCEPALLILDFYINILLKIGQNEVSGSELLDGASQ